MAKGLFMFGHLFGPKGTSQRISSRKSGVSSTLECEAIACNTQLNYNASEDCYEIKVSVYEGPSMSNNFNRSPDIKTFTYKTNED